MSLVWKSEIAWEETRNGLTYNLKHNYSEEVPDAPYDPIGGLCSPYYLMVDGLNEGGRRCRYSADFEALEDADYIRIMAQTGVVKMPEKVARNFLRYANGSRSHEKETGALRDSCSAKLPNGYMIAQENDRTYTVIHKGAKGNEYIKSGLTYDEAIKFLTSGEFVF